MYDTKHDQAPICNH